MPLLESATGLHCLIENPGSQSPFIFVFAHPCMSSIAYEQDVGAPDWSQLSTYAPLISYDARGHGRSPECHEDAAFTWKRLGEDFLQILNETATTYPEKQIIPIGSSMGTGALLYALISPELPPTVSGAVLANAPTYGDRRKASAMNMIKLSEITKTKGIEGLCKAIRTSPPTPFFQSEFPEVREIALRHIAKNDSLSMASAFIGASMSDFPAAELIARISIPVLLLARENDPSHPVDSSEYLNQKLSTSTLHVSHTRKDVQRWPETIANYFTIEP